MAGRVEEGGEGNASSIRKAPKMAKRSMGPGLLRARSRAFVGICQGHES